MQLRRHEKPKPTHPRKKVLVVLPMMFAVCAEVGSQHPVFSSSESGSGLSKITLEPNATSIKVEWTMHDPITTVRDFQVTLKEDDFIRERTYIDSNGPLTTDLFDLVPCFHYTITIQPRDAEGNLVGKSKHKSTITLSAIPPIVTELETESITARSLTLSWERPATACEITAYNITYSGMAKWGPRTEHTGSATIGRSDADTTTSIAIGDLQPYTDYVMTVTASTDTGEGKQAEIKTITTEEDVLTESPAKDLKMSEPPSNTAPARVINDSVTMIVSVLMAGMFNLRFENPAQLMFGTPWR